MTIDNSQNASDVYAKLVFQGQNEQTAVRHFFVKGFESFAVENVGPGNYDVRYRDLDSGHLAKTEPFELVEVPFDEGERSGMRYSQIRMTLYKVAHGNMRLTDIHEKDF